MELKLPALEPLGKGRHIQEQHFGDAPALPELPGQGFAVLGAACSSPDSPLLPKPHFAALGISVSC